MENSSLSISEFCDILDAATDGRITFSILIKNLDKHYSNVNKSKKLNILKYDKFFLILQIP